MVEPTADWLVVFDPKRWNSSNEMIQYATVDGPEILITLCTVFLHPRWLFGISSINSIMCYHQSQECLKPQPPLVEITTQHVGTVHVTIHLCLPSICRVFLTT